MNHRRCYRFAYHARYRDDRYQYPFQMRDGDAALYLITALAEQGYRYVGPIFNFPSDGPNLIAIDDSYLGENDLVVLTTRPPIHDMDIQDKKGFKRSFTTLEDKFFKGPLSVLLERCARSEVLLTALAAGVSPEVAKRHSLLFRQNGGSTYLSYGSPVTGESTKFTLRDALTAVFLIYAQHAWPGGPGLLAAFGMGGTETLVWCHRLATEFPHLLCTTPFVMAEVRTGQLPEHPDTIDFAKSWEVTILGSA